MSYYEFVHRAGYGSADHMADEIIARAARRLGSDTTGYIAACIGLVSHPVPMASPIARYRVTVTDGCTRVESERGVRAAMERALRDAMAEVPSRCRDTRIDIVCRRERTQRSGSELVEVACEGYQDGFGMWRRDRYDRVPTYRTIVEERRGHEWVTVGGAS